MDRYDPKYIDQEERDLLQDLKKLDTHKIAKPSKSIQRKLKAAARRQIEKESKMNIRIDPLELSKLKQKAKTEGLKYQTLVKSILHKYITGQLIEKRKKAG